MIGGCHPKLVTLKPVSLIHPKVKVLVSAQKSNNASPEPSKSSTDACSNEGSRNIKTNGNENHDISLKSE
jgi:hypothetical protein